MAKVRITPQQMLAHWTGADHKFTVNVHNFEVNAGKAAVEVFQGSFDKKRFNSAGASAWARWQGKYSSAGSLLEEYGTLRKSIKVKSIKSHVVSIHTDPREYVGNIRHSGFCYAAVHNNLNSLTNRPQRGPKKERQFIGHSTVLVAELKKLSVHIFDGFPK